MTEQQWRDERDDRTLRYAERRLDPNRWIVLTIEPDYVERYEGQVALLTAANLLGRMSPSVALSIPDLPTHIRLPWRNRPFPELILSGMQAADPFGRFCRRRPLPTDSRLHLGRSGHDYVAHGIGWNVFVGPGPSPLPHDHNENPIGAALSAIVAVSQLFVHNLDTPATGCVLNAFSWANGFEEHDSCLPSDVGSICVVGAGSVGTAALYFLALSGCGFAPTLIDMDRVKIHNLDRSPIFVAHDVGLTKVAATRRFLAEVGIENAPVDEHALHESPLWIERSAGTPDILVSAANEMNVRYHIESRYPPVQLYGTTGRNWQSSVIRHIPLTEACSCCLFRPDLPQPAMSCATGPAISGNGNVQQVDASLPFLSFAAGLMTAAEIMKLSVPGYPFATNRITLSTRPYPRLVPARIPRQSACICAERSKNVHRRMLQGGKYAFLAMEN
jgi:hypothetical protein